MTTSTAPARRESRYVGAPRLRLLASGEQRRFERPPVGPESTRRLNAGTGGFAGPAHKTRRETAPAADAPVLIAGHDAGRRATMIEELERTMAPETRFVHASAFWEVLVLAGESRMVILSGDLDEVPTDSLMRMLGHRYPALPVVALDAPAPALAHA